VPKADEWHECGRHAEGGRLPGDGAVGNLRDAGGGEDAHEQETQRYEQQSHGFPGR
jgi:hypothetical protein